MFLREEVHGALPDGAGEVEILAEVLSELLLNLDEFRMAGRVLLRMEVEAAAGLDNRVVVSALLSTF